jgi:Tfp pilus assembly protein PilO
MRRGNYGFLLLLIAVIGWFAVVRGQIHAFGERSAQVKQLKIEVDSYQLRIADIDNIRSKGDVVQRTLQAFYLAMPRLSQVPETLVMMESLGGTTGVVFSALNVGAPTAAEVPVTLTFTGTQNTVNTFLDAIDKNVRTVSVKNQSVTADKAGNLSVSLQLGLLFQGGGQTQ